jgi:nucleotide-binding universal stress UspA family protein
MLRSILVALDDTPGAGAARDLAIALARRCGAALTAAMVLDAPGDEAEAVPIGGAAFLERRNAALVRRAEAEADAAFAGLAAAAGDLPVATLRLAQAPEAALLGVAPRHDLLVLGRDSTLGREAAEDGLAPVISGLLRHGARPLLVVPPGPPAAEGPLLVAYDGSVPAQRAIASFAQLGLAPGLSCGAARVVSVDADRHRAGALAGEAAALLAAHGLPVEPFGVEGSRPIDIILAEAATLRPACLIAGAYEESALTHLLLGSGTRKLLREAPCPVFLQH